MFAAASQQGHSRLLGGKLTNIEAGRSARSPNWPAGKGGREGIFFKKAPKRDPARRARAWFATQDPALPGEGRAADSAKGSKAGES